MYSQGGPHYLRFLLFLLLLFLTPNPTLPLKLNAPPPPGPFSSFTAREEVSTCGLTCRFRLCVSNGTGAPIVLPNSPYIVFNEFGVVTQPFICLPSEARFQYISTYSEPRVSLPNGEVPISKWSPASLDTPFKPFFVRLRRLRKSLHSGLTTDRPTGNQWSVLNNNCMVVPIAKYIVKLSGARKRKFAPRWGTTHDCVAFRTVAPYLQFQARWDTPDDLDLEVNEPDRRIVDWVSPMSEEGRLEKDSNVDSCRNGPVQSHENILYDSTPNLQPGTYTVRLNHFQKCDSRPTNWEVSVVEGGIRRRFFNGTSSNSTGIAPAFGRTVLDETFTYP